MKENDLTAAMYSYSLYTPPNHPYHVSLLASIMEMKSYENETEREEEIPQKHCALVDNADKE